MIVFIIFAFGLFGWFMATGVKTQWIRLVDIFLYGPFLIYLGIVSKSYILLFMGATTITYNGKNYLLHKK